MSDEDPEDLEDFFDVGKSLLLCVHDLESLFGDDWEANLCMQLGEHLGRPPGSFNVWCTVVNRLHIQIGRRFGDIPFPMCPEDIFELAGNITMPDKSRADHFAVGAAERKHGPRRGNHQCRLQ